MIKRFILHVDMDAFFASVEERDDPRLKNRPIAVIGRNRRTVVLTSSYKARQEGVKTGMNKFQAQEICPEIVFVEADHEKYAKTCSDIVKILYCFSPDLEVYSIDESFLDITSVRSLLGEPLEIGKKIKEEIFKKLKLKCSVGIGPNKLLAKLASSRNKPDGLLWIKEEEVSNILKDLPVEGLCGIGRSTKNTLNSMGIYTCSDLSRVNPLLLRKRFGIMGERLREMAQGKDDSSVMPFGYEPKANSVGHSMTLPYDIYRQDEILKHILELSDMVARRMRREGLSGRTITVTIRYNDFHTFSRQRNMPDATDDTRRIYRNAVNIIRDIVLEKPVRLLGVSVSALKRHQEEFFLFDEDRRSMRLNKALDFVNERFGDGVLTFASLVQKKKFDKVISPAWRPYGARKY